MHRSRSLLIGASLIKIINLVALLIVLAVVAAVVLAAITIWADIVRGWDDER
jgi:hypothetical protein